MKSLLLQGSVWFVFFAVSFSFSAFGQSDTFTWNSATADSWRTNPGGNWTTTGFGVGGYPGLPGGSSNSDVGVFNSSFSTGAVGIRFDSNFSFGIGGTTLTLGRISFTRSNGANLTIGARNGTNGSIVFLGGYDDAGSPKVMIDHSGTNANLTFSNASDAFGGTLTMQFGTASGSIRVANAGRTLTINTQVTGANAFTKIGDGDLVFTAGNSYGGTTTINAGSIRLEGSGTMGSGSVAIGTGAQMIVSRSSSFTISNAISGGGSLSQFGSGTTTLLSSNSYSGGTIISNGTLALGHATNALSNSGSVLVNGGTLELGANSDTVGAVTLASGTISSTAGVLTGSSYDLQSGTLSARIAGSGNVDKTTGGTVVVTRNNVSLSGAVTISGGTLQLGNGLSAGTIGSGSIVNNSVLEINRSSTMVMSNSISGSGSLVHSGSGVTLLTGSNSYGTTLINSGTIVVGTGGTTGSLGAGAVTNNGQLSLFRSDNFVISNDISGTGDLFMVGSGKASLTGNVNLNGLIQVQSGTLAIDGSATTASGVQVDANGVLQGTGTINGNVDVLGKFAPGNSIGSIVVNGDVDFSGGGTLEIEYSGSSIDFLTVAGTLDLTNSTLDLVELAAAPRFTWIPFVQYGSLVGTFATMNLPVIAPDHFVFDYNYNGMNQIAFQAIPEPATMSVSGMLILGNVVCLWRRRRKSNRV